ncbi:hypothetical protein MTF68_01345 [Pseudoalteromonas sp. 2CM37A]|uniref:hypothetical protein n=1 Tax=Pseudoalteromonas sp. 2CM37A TaxID=2929853 RepID=UPI0020BFA9F2|nr:hypothetical protein [Pseudoalteromonas sp. 2CM37A]MCK8116197.1 hypothetical protein [Pseudoalteromonas sp. 2CM37A]
MLLSNPIRLDALIVQNGNAYLEGLTLPRQAFFKAANEQKTQAQRDKFIHSRLIKPL